MGSAQRGLALLSECILLSMNPEDQRVSFAQFGDLYFGTTEKFHREVPGLEGGRMVFTNRDEAWMAGHDEARRRMRDVRGRDVDFGDATLPEVTVHRVQARKYRLGDAERVPYRHIPVRHKNMAEAMAAFKREDSPESVAFRTNAPLRILED